MKIDLTLPIDRSLWNKMIVKTSTDENFQKLGHIGTHLDLMDKKFNIENTIRQGRVIDVSNIKDREIEIEDIKGKEINKGDFIIFNTGHMKEKNYGTPEYFKDHPVLSLKLVDYLIKKQIHLIGIDAVGIRRGEEHAKIDQYCANHNVFIVENLNNLDLVLKKSKDNPFTIYTFPLNLEGTTGLPCRIVAKV